MRFGQRSSYIVAITPAPCLHSGSFHPCNPARRHRRHRHPCVLGCAAIQILFPALRLPPYLGHYRRVQPVAITGMRPTSFIIRLPLPRISRPASIWTFATPARRPPRPSACEQAEDRETATWKMAKMLRIIAQRAVIKVMLVLSLLMGSGARHARDGRWPHRSCMGT